MTPPETIETHETIHCHIFEILKETLKPGIWFTYPASFSIINIKHLDLYTFKESSHGTIFLACNIGGYLVYKTRFQFFVSVLDIGNEIKPFLSTWSYSPPTSAFGVQLKAQRNQFLLNQKGANSDSQIKRQGSASSKGAKISVKCLKCFVLISRYKKNKKGVLTNVACG